MMANLELFRASVVGSLLLVLNGCTVERDVHLYPANNVASTTGVIAGQIVGHGKGYGTARMNLPDGEVLRGEYSIVFGGSVGFGSLFTTLQGRNGLASGIVNSTNVTFDGSGQGSASLQGDKGTSAECEFLNNNMTGHGFGVCKLSKGGLYRMQY